MVLYVDVKGCSLTDDRYVDLFNAVV